MGWLCYNPLPPGVNLLGAMPYGNNATPAGCELRLKGWEAPSSNEIIAVH